MNWDEYGHLLAERGALQQILADIPEDDVLDRGSFQARLQEVESRLAAVTPNSPRPAQARLTFRGPPVIGNHGVMAGFGLKATNDFVVAVTTMAAALTGPLGTSGPIPNRDQNRLLITGTAVGSFGFELEEYWSPQGDQLPLGLDATTTVSLALTQTQELLDSTRGTDDELADVIAAIDPRARGAVRDFLETLATNEAAFALDLSEKSLTFRDVNEVRRSLLRLGQDNVHEELEGFEGVFQGVLPKRRTFEFRLADSDEVMTGRVGPGITDPDVLNQNLRRFARIQVTAVRVGQGRPRYVLNEHPKWLGQSTPSQTAAE